MHSTIAFIWARTVTCPNPECQLSLPLLSSPPSLIDVLHSTCAFREKGVSGGMAEFLARSGQGKNTTLWLVAQAVSEILPDGEKEKQLMQGLLNQREKLEHEDGLLF